jgi:hypothetical protein
VEKPNPTIKMKTFQIMRPWFALGCMASILCSSAVIAEPFGLARSAVNGGGISVGGPYSFTSSIGQFAPGTSVGSRYSVASGFLSPGVAVHTPGAPELSIEKAVANILILWPLTDIPWRLEQSPSVTGVWSKVSTLSSTNGNTIMVSIERTAATQFYRLSR